MKKNFYLMVLALAAAFATQAADPVSAKSQIASDSRNKYTNVYEKVPLEGKYVGYAGIELLSPSYFGDGGANFGIVTSHGYMVTDKIFVGGGVGYIRDFPYGKAVIPIFAEGRYFFQSEYQRRIYPHFGLRAGAAVATEGGTGFVGQMCVGFRIPLTEGFAINLEVGPQYATKYMRESKAGYISETGEPFVKDGYFFSFFARLNFEF